MANKGLVDGTILREKLKKYLKKYHASTFKDLKFDNKSRKAWDNCAKRIYKNEYSNMYNQMRREVAEKKAQRWQTLAGEANFKAVLNELGLTLRCGGVYAIDSGRLIFHWYLENIVIPKIESTFNIKGIKITRDVSPLSYRSCLNFEQVELNETGETAELL